MTGDGVNDAQPFARPTSASRWASPHRRGREAADLVLLDDDFAHIVEAVEEGAPRSTTSAV